MFELCTPDLERIGLIEAYSSMIWQRRYQTPGAFHLTMPFLPICKDLIAERLIAKDSEAGIIENINIAQDANTGENVVCLLRTFACCVPRPAYSSECQFLYRYA